MRVALEDLVDLVSLLESISLKAVDVAEGLTLPVHSDSHEDKQSQHGPSIETSLLLRLVRVQRVVFGIALFDGKLDLRSSFFDDIFSFISSCVDCGLGLLHRRHRVSSLVHGGIIPCPHLVHLIEVFVSHVLISYARATRIDKSQVGQVTVRLLNRTVLIQLAKIGLCVILVSLSRVWRRNYTIACYATLQSSGSLLRVDD